jgi:hypothetical protein
MVILERVLDENLLIALILHVHRATGRIVDSHY